MTRPRTLVFGPAYLDRVLRVDRPLVDPQAGGVLDRSVQGLCAGSTTHQQAVELARNTHGSPAHTADADSELYLNCLPDFDLRISPLPTDWPGPWGEIKSPIPKGREEPQPQRGQRTVAGIGWQDDLGGMGAGYAKAFDGELIWLAGEQDDPTTSTVAALLDAAAIQHRPQHVPGKSGEWTLLVTSGPFGDKLAVGIRTLAGIEEVPTVPGDEPWDLLVAASMTNARACAALSGTEARVKFFAPSLRNMTDPAVKVSQFARYIDILACNSLEWESLADREEVAWRVSILTVTDGPRGALIRFTDETGEPGSIQIPTFPRSQPPRDTNRAGESFASTFVSTLIKSGWSPGVASRSMIQVAAERASAAAALVLDRVDFGFPTEDEIDNAIRNGVV